jgi:serine protease Do
LLERAGGGQPANGRGIDGIGPRHIGHRLARSKASVVGLDNNTSAFQLSAPVQPGNSGGPLLDMNGRVVGMAQGILGTLRAAEALGGAIPQNVNFGITATTVIGFLQAHSVDYIIDTERTKFEPEQIAEEAKKFTVKVTCGE